MRSGRTGGGVTQPWKGARCGLSRSVTGPGRTAVAEGCRTETRACDRVRGNVQGSSTLGMDGGTPGMDDDAPGTDGDTPGTGGGLLVCQGNGTDRVAARACPPAERGRCLQCER